MKSRSIVRWMLASILFGVVCFLAYELPFEMLNTIRRSERRSLPKEALSATEQQHVRERVATQLSQIERLQREKYPNERQSKFFGPANENDVRAIEAYIGRSLPTDFRAYLELHDGQEYRSSFFGFEPLLPCKEILGQSKELLSIYTSGLAVPLLHQGEWYHPAALIFEESDGGGYAINAFNGEVYSWDHDGGSLRLVATSFLEFIETLSQCLEAGDGPYASQTKWDRSWK